MIQDKPFPEWLIDEARRGFNYLDIKDARAAYEAAGYKWDGWVNGMTPTLNLNGTSAEELLEQVGAVLEFLRKAQAAMMHAAPHGRDYQHDLLMEGGVPVFGGSPSFRTAQAEHFARLLVIEDLIRQYEAIQESIDNQDMERKAARAARMAR